MTAPHDRPNSTDASESDSNQTLQNRAAPAKLDDLYPTMVNGPGAPKKAERPALYAFLAPPVGTDEIGRLGQFRVLKLLGAGGMGMVFLAEDEALGRQVALKVIKPKDDNGDMAGQRFLKEARAIAQIKHDNLVTIYQVGQDGPTFFYAMELLIGETLESRVKRGNRWQLAEILRVGLELASGLAAMHANGLIHRDIKPSNIWLEARDEGRGARDEGRGARNEMQLPRPSPLAPPPSSPFAPRAAPLIPRVKILDFGLVHDVKDESALTETGIVMGTPAFMSPEQVRGKKVDARSDLYSFGCILYRLCTGKYPHAADNSMAQLAAVVADEPEPVSALNPEIPPALARLVMQLLAKNPEERPKSAAIVADRLRQIQQAPAEPGRGIDRYDSGSTPSLGFNTSELALQPSFWSRHGRTIFMLLGATLGAMVLGAAVVFLVVFALPKRLDQKKRPLPVNEADKQFLSEMTPVLKVSWPFFKKKDKDKEKKVPRELEFERVFVNGEPSPHGIFMHAARPFDLPASLSYQLDKKFQSFTTKVSISDTSHGAQDALRFTVFGDGKQLWQSKQIRTRADTQEIALDVTDVAILKLQVTIDGQEVGGAHGAWVEPYLVRR